MSENHNSTTGTQSSPSTSVLMRLALSIAVLTVVIYAYGNSSNTLTLAALADKETQIRNYQQQHPWRAYSVAVLAYIVVAGLSLPGAVPLTLVIAWLFGFWRGLIVVSFASTAGATVAFLLSRYLLRKTIQSRFRNRLTTVNESLKEEGAFYLFTLRLIPVVPFFVINVVMGLTTLPAVTFWWVSQLGMLPGTAVYVCTGSQFPDLNSLAKNGTTGILNPQLLAAFVLLGLFPIAVKIIVSSRNKHGQT